MYLPLKEFWCITAFYGPDNELLQWYFDISKGNFLDENAMPCIDDIFLDLVILPNGKPVTLDADELQEALDKGVITADDSKHAYAVHDQILASKWNNVALLTELSNKLLAEYE
jgi:predicted RNA-binding protein associated with RNAse of E/G family